MTSQSVVRASCATVWAAPLRLKVDSMAVMADGSGAAEAAPVASTLRRNGDNTAGAATAPATMPVATLALMKSLRVNFAMLLPLHRRGKEPRAGHRLMCINGGARRDPNS